MENFDIEKAKQQISEWARQRDFIKEIYFFGSRMSGVSHKTGEQFTENSDLDIILRIEPLQYEDLITTWVCDYDDFKNELAELLSIPVSLMLYEDAVERGFFDSAHLVYSIL